MSRYLHLFDNISDLNDYIQNEYEEPFVALTSGQRVDYNKKPILDANGHEYVDLGLPSGTLWAPCNLGAINPEDAGNYFAWGDSELYYTSLDPLTWKQGKTGFDWTNYKFTSSGTTNSDVVLSKYNSTDGKTTLGIEDDPANIILGGGWKVPTKQQIDEILNVNNCTWSAWTQVNNMWGTYCTSNITGNSIFFPCAGYIADSEIKEYNNLVRITSSTLTSTYKYCLGIYKNHSKNTVNNNLQIYRYYGDIIRPVLNATMPVIEESIQETASS